MVWKWEVRLMNLPGGKSGLTVCELKLGVDNDGYLHASRWVVGISDGDAKLHNQRQ